MQGLVLDEGGAYLGIVFPSIVASAHNGLANDDPWVVVAEDARILLVTSGIGRYFAHLDMVCCEGWPVEHNAMLAVHIFLYGVQSFVHHTLFFANACHGAPALALDEDLTLLILLRTNLVAEVVVGTEIPVAVPSALLHGLHHVVH